MSSIAREGTNDSNRPQSLKSPRFFGEKRCSKYLSDRAKAPRHINRRQVFAASDRGERKSAKIAALRDPTETRIEFSHSLLNLCTSGYGCADEPCTIFDAAYRGVYRQVIPIPRLVVAADHGLPIGENESGHFAVPRFDAPPMLLEV